LTTSSNYACKQFRPDFASLVASLTKMLMPIQVSCPFYLVKVSAKVLAY
jgi:hypothetical protein